jgi:signal transduction histidine kinase
MTQKLMDIDIIIRRGVVYGLVTIIMAAILSVAIFVVVTFPDIIGLPQRILLALVLGAIATFLFGPVKKGIEVLADKYLYRDRYDYRQIIANLNSSLKSAKDVLDISRLTIGTVVQTLSLAGGCLFLKDPDNSFEISATQGIFDDIKEREKITTILSQRNGNFVFPNSASDIDPNLSFIIPLVAGDKEVGVLCLSLKSSRQDFSLNDRYLLEGIASVAASSLRSALLLRDVSMRDTFVSVASHELRTPLTVIVGYAELLLQKDPPEVTRKQWLKYILDNGRKITDMVDELLNVTRIQSGKIVMKLENVQLQDVLKDQMLIVKEKSNNHDFIIEVEPEIPQAFVDRDKFAAVIGNLLSNAIKYSPNGGSITLSACQDRRKNRVIVSIKDEGIGIGADDRDLLFTTFHRIQRPETRNIRGSGLGLYIAKEWTKAMGGDIWLRSELNKGSTFFVSVPVAN